MIEQILLLLRTLTRGALEVLEESRDGLTVRVGRHEGALITIRISDPTRPSLRVSYPKVVVKRDGSRQVTEETVDGVVTEGLEWIVALLLPA